MTETEARIGDCTRKEWEKVLAPAFINTIDLLDAAFSAAELRADREQLIADKRFWIDAHLKLDDRLSEVGDALGIPLDVGGLSKLIPAIEALRVERDKAVATWHMFDDLAQELRGERETERDALKAENEKLREALETASEIRRLK